MNRLFLPVSNVPSSLYDVATHVDRVFDHLLGSKSNQGESASPQYVPRLDVYEHEDAIEIRMDLPGMSAADLKVESKDRMLTIEGERPLPSFDDSTKPWHRGIPYGNFQRTIQLSEMANTEAIEASYDAGVLRLMISKFPKLTPKQIQVRSADAGNVAQTG